MPRVITNVTTLGVVAEVTPGTIPASPAFNLIRITGEDFDVVRDFATSDEFNPKAMITDQIITKHHATGGFKFEYSNNDAGMESLLESALQSTWAVNTLDSGVIPKFHTLEVRYEAGATDSFKRLTGMLVNEMDLEFTAGEKVTAGMSFMGMTSVFATAQVATPTYNAPGTNTINVVSNMTLTSTGLTVDSVTKLSLKIANNCREHFVIPGAGTAFTPNRVQPGTNRVTGTMEFFVDAGVLDQATVFSGNTTFSLLITIGTGVGTRTRFQCFNCKFNSLKVVAAGNGQDVMATGDFEAFAHTSAPSINLRVNRQH